MKNKKSNNSGCLVTIFPFLKLIKPKNKGKIPYAMRDDFLSNAELSFYKVLGQALQGEVIICTKVGLSDIFFVKSKDLSEKATYFNKIAKKHVDFLLCRVDNLKPICGIELDDLRCFFYTLVQLFMVKIIKIKSSSKATMLLTTGFSL